MGSHPFSLFFFLSQSCMIAFFSSDLEKIMLCLPSIPRCLTLLLLQVGRSYAKFEAVFPGYATERLLYLNSTKANYTARGSCRRVFACILNDASNYDQAILGSGTSVLGFVSRTPVYLRQGEISRLQIFCYSPDLILILQARFRP